MKHLVQSSKDVDNRNEVAASDQVELSSQTRDIERAREVAQDAPEVRMDKIEAARRALQRGTLNLNGHDLAEKLLENAQAESRNA